MTHAHIELPDHESVTAPSERIRVSVREIRETAYRALYAAGASAGEADCAAGVVTAMQVHAGTGIAALLRQISAIDPARLRVPIDVTADTVVVLKDPAQREQVLIGPPAVDFAVAAARHVLIPHLTGHEVLDWYALDAAVRLQATIWVAAVDETGHCVSATVLTPEGEMHCPAALPEPLKSDIGAQCKRVGGAVAVFSGQFVGMRPVHTATELAHRYRQAVDRGTYIDAETWSRAYVLGRRFLIPEESHD
ncbi:hypothetical protein AFM11_12830 [Mycolicibacterium wolinskyi]|uniref:Uncharacterized protein n=1 Tax=Mycolicibacterium wolinskyi TaxID=59750 RepID=A0A132PMW4_9MYCO|nr:hypothetical protein [Mycolicibacterium wolinskyi]KWX23676.1 hypothetical protein AFM11_12830 [Mycolicibacterium wolinskyi]